MTLSTLIEFLKGCNVGLDEEIPIHLSVPMTKKAHNNYITASLEKPILVNSGGVRQLILKHGTS